MVNNCQQKDIITKHSRKLCIMLKYLKYPTWQTQQQIQLTDQTDVGCVTQPHQLISAYSIVYNNDD